MKTKMFGYRSRKGNNSARTPGEPWNTAGFDRSDEDEESYGYAKEHDSEDNMPPGSAMGRAKDNPSNYEGREHVKYKDPGHSSHNIRFPEDEPHMKSHVNRDEMHEMEDNYHHSVPNQTHYTLEEKLKRARMKMDAPDQEDPDPLRGNIVHNVGYGGEEDTSGEEEMGPNDMQSGMPKEHRKKMIVAVTKAKMNKNKY